MALSGELASSRRAFQWHGSLSGCRGASMEAGKHLWCSLLLLNAIDGASRTVVYFFYLHLPALLWPLKCGVVGPLMYPSVALANSRCVQRCYGFARGTRQSRRCVRGRIARFVRPVVPNVVATERGVCVTGECMQVEVVSASSACSSLSSLLTGAMGPSCVLMWLLGLLCLQ